VHQASWDPVWESVFRSQEWGKYPPEFVVRFVARRWYRVSQRHEVRLLDLGSGPGACAWYLAREGFSVSAIDGSPTAIAQLNTRLATEGLCADGHVGDIVELPWADDTFDGVIDNAALYANPFAQARRIISEVHRVLKPGGHLLSANFSDRCWGNGLGREIEPGGFTDIAEGPFKDKGFSRFSTREQVQELYGAFRDVVVDSVAWTLGGERHVMELWVVEGRKGEA